MSTLRAGAAVGVDTGQVADIIGPRLAEVFGELPVQIEFWDGSSCGRREAPGRIRVNSAEALRRMLWSPDQLGLARSFVVGDLDVGGSVADTLRALNTSAPRSRVAQAVAIPRMLAAARQLGVLAGPPPAVPSEELVTVGRRHSLSRDRRAISHHYDVGNEFYEIVLGDAMTYSCARFTETSLPLADAQAAKHDLVCRKLGLSDERESAEAQRPRKRLLDVGCGWGSMALHAAANFDVDVVGVTISEQQAEYAGRRVAAAGLEDRIEIRLQDYRETVDGPFDAISSIGMSEHVGSEQLRTYFQQLYGLLAVGGRLLNHAISSPGGLRLGRRAFVHRYVFPDGELIDVGDTQMAMERAGFEIRDVENLREHYAITLRHWVANLEAHWDDAVALVGERRARVWLLYMSGSINGFDDAGLQLHQVLGVRNAPDGISQVPLTRNAWT